MTDLVPGDIVAFEFPFRCGRAPYARPCLVIEASEREVLLAYGTSAPVGANGGHEIRVHRDFAACGLDRPSRFVTARRIRVRRSDPRLAGARVHGCLPVLLRARIERLLPLLEAAFPSPRDRHAAERDGLHPGRWGRGRRHAAA